MPFQLCASVPDMVGDKDTGENILLANLAADYKVYAFYYPGQPIDTEFEAKLRAFGDQTGKNLLINIGRYNDPQFDRIVGLFGIKKYPVIVMTALDALAASDEESLTAFVRLDSEALLSAHDRALLCIQDLFNLFLTGKVAMAMSHAKWAQRAEVLRTLGAVVRDGLSKIAGVVLDRDISLSFATIKLELKRPGAGAS